MSFGDFIDTARCAVFLEHRACPRHCGALLMGKDWQYHLDYECPERELMCTLGCGMRVSGEEFDSGEHAKTCPMNMYLERAERALQESAVKEYRLAMENAYQERERARGRIKARAERDPGSVFTSLECKQRVRRIEAEGHNLLSRARRKAREKLVNVIAVACQGEDAGKPSDGPTSAAKFWDTIDNSKEYSRRARPWDVGAPVLDPLFDVLEEARICSADPKLRRQAEALLLASCKRGLEAALETNDDQSSELKFALRNSYDALKLCELEDPGDLPAVIRLAEDEAVRAGLREKQTTSKEFLEAVKGGDVDLAAWLLDKEQANPSFHDPRSGIPPIVTAAKAGDISMCELLIEKGTEIDGRCTADGTTALHWTSHARSSRVVSLLLSKSANPRLQDKRGQDALMKLVRRDFYNTADGCEIGWEPQYGRHLSGPELLSSGYMNLDSAKVAGELDPACVGFSVRGEPSSDTDMRTYYIILHGAGRVMPEKSEADFAAEAARIQAIADALARKRKDLEDMIAAAKGKQKAGLMQQLAEMDKEEKKEKVRPPTPPGEKLRLRPGEVEVNGLWTYLDYGWTVFIKAANDPAHDVREMVTAGGDAGAQDLDGLTPLHHHLLSAPGRGSPACVAALLQGAADVNTRDYGKRGTTPFLIAVQCKRADLVKMMMEEAWPPGDVDTKAQDGTSALAMANASGAREVADLLRKAGASEWDMAEVRLGSRTVFSFDTRKPPLVN